MPSLRAAADVVVGARPPSLPDAPASPGSGPAEPDLADVRGHATPLLALQIAAAGGHNLLLEGPPGHRQDDAGPPAAVDPAAR